jgi:hypothetical protein
MVCNSWKRDVAEQKRVRAMFLGLNICAIKNQNNSPWVCSIVMLCFSG